MTATIDATNASPHKTAEVDPPTVHETDTPTSEESGSAAPVVMMLDPQDLLVDMNVRGTVHLDKDFLASIEEHGVLVPIVAVRTAEGAYRVRYGQRRTMAAVAAHRTTVPVVVLGAEQEGQGAEIERIVTQVHENDLRAGLSAADKAGAVEQLAAFGLSAGQIVKKVKGSRADVDRALAVSASALAKKSVERYAFLTLEQAAAVAEFENEPETVKALVVAAKKSDGTFAHAAQQARDKRAQAQARAELEKQLTEAGVRIVPPPEHGDRTVKSLVELVSAAGKQITAAGHSSCPGHAAYVGRRYWSDDSEAVYVCTDWKANGHRDTYRADKTPASQMTTAEREKATAERRQVIENNKAWKSAENVRRAWLKQFLTRKTALKGAAVFVATELAYASHELGKALEYDGGKTLYELLGVADKRAFEANTARASDARAQVLALAFVLAAYEAQTSPQTWRRRDPDVGRYFAYLITIGYELAEVEKLCLPKPTKQRRDIGTAAGTPATAPRQTPAVTAPATTTSRTRPAAAEPAESADDPRAIHTEAVTGEAVEIEESALVA